MERIQKVTSILKSKVRQRLLTGGGLDAIPIVGVRTDDPPGAITFVLGVESIKAAWAIDNALASRVDEVPAGTHIVSTTMRRRGATGTVDVATKAVVIPVSNVFGERATWSEGCIVIALMSGLGLVVYLINAIIAY